MRRPNVPGPHGLASLVGAALLALALALPASPAAAQAGAPAAARPDVSAAYIAPDHPDIEHDGAPDLVVGVPRADSSAGAVDVRLSSGPTSRLTRASVPGGMPTAGDRFGAAVVLLDADDDGYTDVMVGAPGEGTGGAVHVFFGGPTGIVPGRALTVASDRSGDEFGAALAPGGEVTVDDTYRASLWIGIPGRAVGGHAAAGAVAQWVFTAPGAGPVGLRWWGTWTQDSAGVPGAAEAGDRFGEVLSFTIGLAVGVPHEDIGSRADAGMVVVRDENGRWTGWTQGTAGVADVPEAGDRLGASLDGVLVGVPGEDVDGHRDAGALQVWHYGSDRDWSAPAPLVVQGSSLYRQRVPGAPEAGDRFGASVRVYAINSQTAMVAVGAPGEDIGTTPDAGVVDRLPIFEECSPGMCPATDLYRGHGLPGARQAGDQVGAALSSTTRDLDEPGEDEATDDLVVGAPGDDDGSTTDAGAVFWQDGTYRPLGGAVAGLRYGAALGLAY